VTIVDFLTINWTTARACKHKCRGGYTHCARDSLIPLNRYQTRRCRGKSFLATGVTRGLATLCTCARVPNSVAKHWSLTSWVFVLHSHIIGFDRTVVDTIKEPNCDNLSRHTRDFATISRLVLETRVGTEKWRMLSLSNSKFYAPCSSSRLETPHAAAREGAKCSFLLTPCRLVLQCWPAL